MKILFMGTPDFAVTALRALYEKYKEDVVGVVTRIDMPKNRGHALTPPPVKVAALEMGLPVYQPQNLKEENFRETLESLAPDIIVVAAYGKILPEYVLNYPKHGCINIHASYLPEYRGAAPIARAIMDGKKELGITIMYMEKGLDTGDMLARKMLTFENENKGEAEEALAKLGAEMMLLELTNFENSTPSPREKQDDALSCYAAKIEKEDCVVDFTRSPRELFNFIRGLSPMPCAMTKTPDGKLLKLCTSVVLDGECDAPAGQVLELDTAGDGKIVISCGNGKLAVTSVVPEGKKRMAAADFIRGRKLNVGDILTY